MKKANTPTPQYPLCDLCRDHTPATMSLQVFEGEDQPWNNYCDVCGPAMASVIRDAQNRLAEIKKLDPPTIVPQNVMVTPPAPKKTQTTKKNPLLDAMEDVQKEPPTPPAPKPTRPVPPAPKGPGYDLLAMLGMKK